VLIYPVSVQGEAAPRDIVNALRLAGERRECDVLIVARGGGSLEDLLAFNDETGRARAFCVPDPDHQRRRP
jgi:exodeoxyribonuclease VII large subunit